MSMDHLLSAGYLVESGGISSSTNSFSTHLLTFSNQQHSEQVLCKQLDLG